jgi:limonene-1,2-epoxide hydrolase
MDRGELNMANNETAVRSFIAAWSRLDANELVGFFTEDGTYHNMMAKPVSGRENLRKFIAGFLKGWTATEWDIVNIVSRGDVVMAERLDRTRLDDKKVDLPCVGVFEMQDGKIKVWRDYFDLATFTKAVV